MSVKRIIAAFIAALLLCINVFCAADLQSQLSVTRCVQISDSQLLIEFSQPVAINLNGTNRGPWIALRVVDRENTLQYVDGQPLQYQGDCRFVGSTHDVIIFEYDNATDIINFKGDYEKFYAEDLKVKMCIEEVPFNSEEFDDELLDNVTTADGSIRLGGANGQPGWDGVYTEIEKDFDHKIDSTSLEPLTGIDNFEYGKVLAVGDAVPPQSEQNKTSIWVYAGVGVILIGICLFAVIRKARKSK